MPKGLNRSIDVKANLSLDTSQAKTQLKALQRDITKMSQGMSLTSLNGQAGITAELTNAVKLTSQLSTALKDATNNATGNLDLTKFNDSLRRTGTTLSDYQRTLSSLGDSGTKAFNDLNKAILSAETPMLRTTELAKETLNTLGNTIRWQATSSLIHGVMGTASQAMNYVRRLDSSLNSIQIVTGKSADTMTRFAKQANEAAKSLSTTTNEYAKAALIYYQQGLSDQQVEGRVATTLKLANVSGQTAAKVSDQMTSIWNNFYDGSKSLEYYADVMTALGASTATSSKEIATGLSKFSSIAKTTGLSYEYATSALATITAATRQSADSVGTSLKTMFSRLQGLSLGDTLDDGTTLNKYSKALLAIGVNIKEANGELKGMDTILNEIGSKWQSLTKDTQIALAQTVGGVRNYTSLLTLMNNWEQFRTNVGTARMSGGTLQKQADIYADSWEAASTRVRAASESIYKNLIDDKVFKAATNSMANTLETVGKVTDAMGGFKGVLLSTAGVATQLFGGEISQALGNVGYNIKSVVSGQAEVQALRQEALRNLLTPTSRMDNIVGDIETTLNKNLVDRLTTYQNKVDQGKIAEWQTAAYQQLLSKAAEQDTKTLAALEKATEVDTASSRYGYNFGYNLRTAANNITDKALKDAAETFLEGSDGKRSGGREAYENLAEIAKTSIILEDLNTKYWNAIPAETGMATSVTAMKNLAGTVMQLGAGAKELNISFKELVGDKDTAIQLESMYNHLNQFIEKTGPITESNLRKYQEFFEETYGNFGETLEYALNKSAFGGQGYSNRSAELQDTLVNVFGYSQEQANQMINQAQMNSRAAGEAYYNKVMNVGASVESNQAIMNQLNSNTRKHMDMSQAITDQIALFTSSAAAYGTMVETLNTLTSGSASVTDRIVALGTSFGTLKSAMSAAGNIFENFNSQIDIFGKSSPLTVGGLTAMSGAALGLVNIGQNAIQAYQDSTIEAQITRLQEAAVFAKEQSSVATESYETLLSSTSHYNTLLSELYTLRSGTSDFAQTLLSTNEAALNLADRYGLTATRGSYGEILFDSGELREKTQAYESAAMQAQTRALLGTQLSNFYEQYATYDRLNNTALWDKDENLGAYLNNLGGAVGSGLSSVIDFVTKPLQQIFPLNQEAIDNLNNQITGTFGNIGNAILNGADSLTTAMHQAGILSDQTTGVLAQNLLHLQTGSDLETLTNMAQSSTLTLDKYAEFYNAMIKDAETTTMDWRGIPIEYSPDRDKYVNNYTEFKARYGINDITLGYRAPVDWSGLVTNGQIDWKGVQERLGQSISNLVPVAFDTVVKQSLGLSPDASDNEIGAALADYTKSVELNQLKLEATTANMVNGVIAGESDLSMKQQLASQLLGMSGATGLYSFIPETVESLRKLSTEDLQSQYKDLIKPLNNDYLQLSKDQLIAAIQTEEIRQNILGQVNKITKDITAADLEIARNYQDMAIGSLNAENIDEKWGNFYRYQGAMAIQNLGTAILNSFSPEELRNTFANIEFGENFAENFGKTLTNWVTDQGYSINDVQNLANWTSNARNSFGQRTAEFLFGSLTQNGTLKGGLDQNTQRALRTINFESSLSAMASLRASRDNVTDSSLREILNGFYDKASEDIGGESGLFAKLLNSSDFAKVSASLQQVYEETGTISASLVQALSKKSSSLNAYLNATEVGNAGSVAAVMRALSNGSLTTSDLSNQVMEAFGHAYEGTGGQAARQQEIKDFDFEDSSASIINKWFKNAGTNVKNGWNAGYLSDPAVMQIMNMLAGSTKSNYYNSMMGGLQGQMGSKAILQNFKASDPAATKFISQLTSKYGASMMDLMNYIQAETGLFPSSGDLFTLTSAGYSLNGNMKSEFEKGGMFETYGKYLQQNYKEFTKTNGQLDVDYLFNSSAGFRRLTEDYLSGQIKDANGKSLFGNSWFDFNDAQTWAGMMTEHTASGSGMAQNWDAHGIKKALQTWDEQGFVSDAALQAFFNEAILNNENPNISGEFKDYNDFKTRTFLSGMTFIGDNFWKENNSKDFLSALGTTENRFWDTLNKEGIITEVIKANGVKANSIDLSKAYNFLTSSLLMTDAQATAALEQMAETYHNIGAYIYDKNGNYSFMTYEQWSQLEGNVGKSFDEFWESIKDSALTDQINNFTTNLFNSIKSTLGLTNEVTQKIEEDINKYLHAFASEGIGGGIRTFLQDVFGDPTSGIGKVVSDVKNFFKDTANGIVSFFTDNTLADYAGKGILDIGKDIIKGAIDDLKGGAPKLAGLLTDILGLGDLKFSESIGKYRLKGANGEGFYGDIKDVWGLIGSTVADNVKGALGGALNFVDEILDWDFVISDDSGDGYDLTQSVKNFGNQVWNRITAGLSNAIRGTAYEVENHTGNIFFEDAFGNITSANASDLWEGIGNTVLTGISDFVTNTVIPKIQSWTTSGLSWIDDKIFTDSNFMDPDGDLGKSIANLGNNILARALTGIGQLIGGENFTTTFKDIVDKETGQVDIAAASRDIRKAITPTLAKIFGDSLVTEKILNEDGTETDTEAIDFGATIANVKNNIVNGFNDFIGNIYNYFSGHTGGIAGFTDSDGKVYYGQIITATIDAIKTNLSSRITKFQKGIIQTLLPDLGVEQIQEILGGNSQLFWDSLTDRIHNLPQELGQSIANLLFPGGSEDLTNMLGMSPESLGDYFKHSLIGGLANLVDSLTGFTGNDSLFSQYYRTQGEGLNIADIVSALFSDKGMSGLGNTVGTAITSALGKAGEGILDLFGRGSADFKYIDGTFYRGYQLDENGEPKQGEQGSSFLNVLKDLSGAGIASLISGKTYHGFNGRLYTDAEWENGAPKDYGIGNESSGTTTGEVIADQANQILAAMFSTLTGNDYRATTEGVFRFEGDKQQEQFSINGLVQQLGNSFISGGLEGLNGSWIGGVLENGLIGNTPIGKLISYLSGEDSSGKTLRTTDGVKVYANTFGEGKNLAGATNVIRSLIDNGLSVESAQALADQGFELTEVYNGKIQHDSRMAQSAMLDILGEDIYKTISTSSYNDQLKAISQYLQLQDQGLTQDQIAFGVSNTGNLNNLLKIISNPDMNTPAAWGFPTSSSNANIIDNNNNNVDNTLASEAAKMALETYKNIIKPYEEMGYANPTEDDFVKWATKEGGYSGIDESILRSIYQATEDIVTNTETTATNTGDVADAYKNENGTTKTEEERQQEEKEKEEEEETKETNLPTEPPEPEPAVSNDGIIPGNVGDVPVDQGSAPSPGSENSAPADTGGMTPEASSGFNKLGEFINDVFNFFTGEASGQNNTRILQFAQGHMAVTGELGPELTIRENGTIDMLGQHGREYTWVNPNDIIYTAAQTASILGNNNIEWLDGFAKGFNNKILGHELGWDPVAAVGGIDAGSWTPANNFSGGSGIGEAVRKGALEGTKAGMAAAAEEAKDPRYDPNTLKERDIVTRYFTILQQIDDITRQVEHFGKVAERAWGEERVQAIQRQTDAYKEQYAAYQKYMAEIETYLRSDQDALTLMVEEFARDFKEKTSIDIFGGEASGGSGSKAYKMTTIGNSWASGYNNNVKPHASGYLTEMDSLKSKIAAGSGSSSSDGLDPNLRNPINWVTAEYDANGVLTNYREIVERMIEVYNENAEAFAQDKEAQYKFQEMLKNIQFYTDSLNLYEQQKEVMYDLKNAILDNQVRKIVYEISYKDELDNNALKEINYNFEKIRDNAYRSAEAIDYYATKMDYLDKSNERYKEGIKDILATYSGNITNGIQNQIMMRLYRKAPMEGYIGGGDGSKSSVEASATVTTDKLIEEAAALGNVDAINKVLHYTEWGLTSAQSGLEEGEKLAVDHIDDNGIIHLNDGSIIDPTKKKRYKEKLPTEDEPEPEELPYFPTSGEIDEYFQNFKAVKIGEETYYMPNTDDVEIREDMVQPVDITRAILNNKGEITDDQKELITAQVKSWYDELAKVAPKLAADIKPIYENGFMTNFREVITGINEANAQMSDYMYDLLINDTEEFFRVWSEVTPKNADFQDITTETATQLESMIDTIYANLQQKEKYIETVFATLGNDIKTFSKELNAQVDEFEYFNEVINDYENIINLTNRRSTNIGSDLIAAISDAQLGNAMNKVSGTKTVRDTMAQMKARVQETYDLTKNAFETYRDELLKTMTAEEAAQNAHYLYLQNKLDQAQDEMDIANAKFEDSNKQFLKAWEDALSKIEQNYTKAVEEASRTFEESFSPYFNTLELLQAQFERQKALEDYYVDDFERIHDLAALDRSIEQSILDTDNLKSKGRLRDLQKEINDLQEDGTELSAYDLDILQKKYDLELARQALEDAKDAKSLVRLARDNNGNWSYVYTSNETKVDEAEQNYENAIRSMEEANQNYIDNLEAQILQVQQSALAAMQGLKITDFANLDEFYAALKNIEDGANETTRYLSEQLGHAFDNNEYLDPFIKDRYNGQNLHNLTTDWNDMTLAAVSGINTLDDAIGSIDNRLGALRDKLIEEFIKYSEEQAKVYELAGADIANANGYFSEGINEVMAMSDENVEKTTELADRVGDAFEKTAAKVRDFNKDIFDLTAEYEKLNSVMIKFLEISGEYVPEEKLDFSTTIDTYKELDEIKQVLGKYGKLIVTDYDEQGNRRIYNLEENTEATAEQFDAWYDAIAKADAIDVGKDLDSQEEYDKINAYLEKHGQVYISIDGELKKLSKDNEEDMAWLQDKLTAIQEAAKQMEQSIAYFGDYVESSPGKNYDGPYYAFNPDTGTSTVYPYYGAEKAVGTWNPNTGVYTPVDTGGYTGRWQGAVYADTGMYTGEWDGGSERKNGRLAWLHQKELVLNAHDTENFLDAMNIVRQLDNLASWMANGLGDLFMPRVEGNDETLEQNVHIEASFPNAVDHNEIEQAFGNLVNLASQYANRKAFA